MARTATRSSAATIIMGIAGAIAAIIVVGILLVVLGANQSNVLVDLVLDVGRFFATPFADLFPRDDPETDVVVNWGIAALVYLLVGALLARLARR
jgi:hypothetical protein